MEFFMNFSKIVIISVLLLAFTGSSFAFSSGCVSSFKCTSELETGFNDSFTIKNDHNNFSLDTDAIRSAQYKAVLEMQIDKALWDRTLNPIRFGYFEYLGKRYSFAGYIGDRNELHDSYTSAYTASVIVFFEYNTDHVVGSIDADDDMSIFTCKEGTTSAFANRIRE